MIRSHGQNDELRQVISKNRSVVDDEMTVLCAMLSVIVLVMYILARLDFIAVFESGFVAYLLADEIFILVTVIIHVCTEGKKSWTRFLFFAVLMYTALVISALLAIPYLIFAIPIVIVSAYYNKMFTLFISVIGLVLMCTEPFVSAYMGIVDLNYCELSVNPDGSVFIKGTWMTQALNKLKNFTVPSLFIYALIAALSIWSTDRGLMHLKDRTALIAKQSAIENELSIASDIQLGMLPTVFPDTENYSIAAAMRPAKVVGGDFYDYIRIDDSHIAFLIGDVSGKGVPAALFMASARTLIRSNIQYGTSTDGVMDHTNSELYKTNTERLFVTAWLGVLNLKDGTLTYVNAGHNPPYVIHADNTVEMISSKPNFVLGRKRGIRYREYRMQLTPGDRIFLYTDGLTDSVNSEGRMYNVERVVENLSSGGSDKEIIPHMLESVDSFSVGTEQFDDITMLLVNFKSIKTVFYSEGKEFPANVNGHDPAISYIHTRLDELGCPEKVIKDMELSASEILSNIDMYAYQGTEGGTVRISVDIIDRIATVVFRDTGPEYNPLERSNPDVEKRIKEHKIGGFGIFIVRKLMDDVRYERTHGMNVLTIMKEI